MRPIFRVVPPTLVAVVALASIAAAQIPGGGPARTDCIASWQVTTPALGPNRGPTGVDCEDGDPACDVDRQADGVCTLGVSVCAAGSGCDAGVVSAVAFDRAAARTGLVAPPLPAAAPACGPATIVRLGLRTTARGTRPSRRLVLGLRARADGGTDRDVLRLRCVPNRGTGACPANPAGGPRELALVVAATGTDLDNGVSGQSHNFPVPGGATLRMCLSGCDAAGDPACAQDEAATDLVQADTFGPPLPLLAAGVPVCVVNRFASPGLVGGGADLATGAVSGELRLLSDVFLTDVTQICPRCSASAVGGTGTCQGGRRAGAACRTESILAAGTPARQFTLSADCPPTGPPVGTLSLALPLTTGVATLAGPRPCGARLDDGCGAGTCDAACTGIACVATVDGACVDTKGGVSQVCCSNATQLPCFPTGSGAGAIVRTGTTTPPVPAWPDPTYPKTAPATLASTFCEPGTGSNVIDTVSGLPGPGALVLPVTQTWVE